MCRDPNQVLVEFGACEGGKVFLIMKGKPAAPPRAKRLKLATGVLTYETEGSNDEVEIYFNFNYLFLKVCSTLSQVLANPKNEEETSWKQVVFLFEIFFLMQTKGVSAIRTLLPGVPDDITERDPLQTLGTLKMWH